MERMEESAVGNLVQHSVPESCMDWIKPWQNFGQPMLW